MCGKISKKMVKQMTKSRRKKYFSKDCKITNIEKNFYDGPVLRQVLEDDIERSDIISFIERCLKTAPSSRATISDLLTDPLFDCCHT